MERELRAVLVGCGGISRVWLDAIGPIPGLEVVGLVDLEEAAASKRADEYGLRDALVSADLRATLENARPDVVFDCTVPEAHVDVTLEALRHGCHVLGEKPMADSLANARRMVAAAQEAGRLYAVTQNYRYDPGIRRLASFLESGGIGRITTVHSDFYIGAHFGGFRDRMQHVLLLDMAIHTFDAARFVTGTDPVSVTCQEWNPPGSWYDHGASAAAVFHMTGGIVYTYRGSWCAEGLNTAWAGEWRVIGERGSARWDGGERFQAQVVTETGGFFSTCQDVDVLSHSHVDKADGHARLIQEFVHSIRTGTTPETICTDNIKSLAMVLGAVESAELGRNVEIEW
jgi:predicted dehydrogenase